MMSRLPRPTLEVTELRVQCRCVLPRVPFVGTAKVFYVGILENVRER